jgi:hypothetical protein
MMHRAEPPYAGAGGDPSLPAAGAAASPGRWISPLGCRCAQARRTRPAARQPPHGPAVGPAQRAAETVKGQTENGVAEATRAAAVTGEPAARGRARPAQRRPEELTPARFSRNVPYSSPS